MKLIGKLLAIVAISTLVFTTILAGPLIQSSDVINKLLHGPSEDEFTPHEILDIIVLGSDSAIGVIAFTFMLFLVPIVIILTLCPGTIGYIFTMVSLLMAFNFFLLKIFTGGWIPIVHSEHHTHCYGIKPWHFQLCY